MAHLVLHVAIHTVTDGERSVVETDEPDRDELWQAGMATHTLQLCGAVHADAEILTVGDTAHVVARWLAGRVRRVFAVGQPSEPLGRVVVQGPGDVFAPHGDGSLHGVVVAADAEVQEALLDEACRALAPGGVLSLSAWCDDGDALASRVLGGRRWSLVAPFAGDDLGEPVDGLVHLAVMKHLGTGEPYPVDDLYDAPEPAAAASSRRLAAHLADRVVVIDGGVRFGFAASWVALAPHVRLVGFEPHEPECDRLTREYAGVVDATLVAKGLAAEPEVAEFQITRAAWGSSRFTPDLAGTAHLGYQRGAEVREVVEVEFVRLDDWCADNGVERVDAIKLDIEGGELDALRGSTRLLRDVRALQVEVKFSAVNVGQPLYGEIAAFLDEHGFALWRLRNLAHYALKSVTDRPEVPELHYFDSLPIQFSAPDAQLNWCDAIFVARDAFTGAHPGWEQRVRDAIVFDTMTLPALAMHALQDLVATDAPPAVKEAARDRIDALAATARS